MRPQRLQRRRVGGGEAAMGGGCEIAALLQGRLSSSCLAMV